ncbi:hypothetical protein BGW36DRAFT_350779 [Talaromyces proteolyticus]|uniref:Xylanolytic transcriptional activator regulatory domain-containing protein n=1 Tax=Talaromyces proteolyticus TaxID=1131652 RepID=A0AAD4KEL8_9EURO|nr:uncharacterized protein BGW36DRAFT_350779 [Talaromyces proteolyticus]KAH8689849.1 hypothetical protein BGW36DRAFT_350779 [Talaromyces proteolyticus]
MGNKPLASSPKNVDIPDIPVFNSPPPSKDSQMLIDSKGRFIYVGESASLSFLETVRSSVQDTVGPCAFTNEPVRNPMFESSPKIRFETAQEPLLDLVTAPSLVKQFFLAVSGILDLFDPPWLIAQLQGWIEQPSQISKANSAIIHLALAIGAQGRAQGELDELLAEQCFAYGRQLIIFNLMNDPSLASIQAVMLMTYYMIAACQYNAAFINLGVAARSAYTLGIHLHETNQAFGGGEGLARERAWKSLRVCDLFLAASLGRPPATSESISNIAWAPINSLREYRLPGVAGQVFSAMFRICNVFERVLVEIYAEKAVSLELAKSISRQHRQWTEELPRMLMVDGLEESCTGEDPAESPRNFGLSPRHGSRIVTMAYYYSIVLLTRPFLTFQVRNGSEEPHKVDSSTTRTSFADYADACVISSIKGIDIAYEYVFKMNTPRRQPIVVNSVFISALCLGLASLNTCGHHKWPLGPSLDRAITILTHLGELSTQSAQYAEVCRQLKEAGDIYATRRDDSVLQQNYQVVRSIFGDLQASSKVQSYNENPKSNTVSPGKSGWSVPAEDVMIQTPPLFDFSTIQKASTVPTSGLLPGQGAIPSHSYNQYDSGVEHAQDHHPISSTADLLSGYFHDQDVPLFPLTSISSTESYFGNYNLG